MHDRLLLLAAILAQWLHFFFVVVSAVALAANGVKWSK
jgi:hypothetical protein